MSWKHLIALSQDHGDMQICGVWMFYKIQFFSPIKFALQLLLHSPTSSWCCICCCCWVRNLFITYNFFCTVQVRDAVMAAGFVDTKENCWSYFILRCRSNLHMTLAMSPVGETLRTRCRNFPGLVSTGGLVDLCHSAQGIHKHLWFVLHKLWVFALKYFKDMHFHCVFVRWIIVWLTGLLHGQKKHFYLCAQCS